MGKKNENPETQDRKRPVDSDAARRWSKGWGGVNPSGSKDNEHKDKG